jgi:hypothetical protein
MRGLFAGLVNRAGNLETGEVYPVYDLCFLAGEAWGEQVGRAFDGNTVTTAGQ